MDKKYLFINNPISGASKNNFREVFESYKNKFPSHKIINTTHIGHAKELASQHANNFDAIIAVGGDGTVNEIASALVSTNTPLGIIPQGSGNGFANHLGISNKSEKALEQLLNGRPRAVDTVLINNKSFVNVAGIGFDGHITQLFNKTKQRGLWSYARLIVKEYLHFKEFEYTLSANKNTFEGQAFIIALANSTQYGNNFRIAPKAKSNDGLVNVMLIKKPSLLAAPFIAWNIFRGKGINNNYCTEIITKDLTLHQTNKPLHIDGEESELTSEKIEIKVTPNSLLVIS